MNSTFFKTTLFTLISFGAIGCVNCPEYSIPDCKTGTQLVEQLDEYMCSVASCEALRDSELVTCPVYELPECNEDGMITWAFDELGCEIPICEPYHVEHCPSTAEICEPNEESILVEVDTIGCEIRACVSIEQEPVSSPQPEPVYNERNPNVEALVTWSYDERYRQRNILLSEDRLSTSIEADSVNDTVLASAFTTEGKWYWEVTLNELNESSYNAIGVCSDHQSTEVGPGFSGGVGYSHDGFLESYTLYSGDEYSSWVNGTSYHVGDTVGVILDAGLRKVWFIVHGDLMGGGDPESGEGGIDLSPENDSWAPCLTTSQGYHYRANFGQEDWVYGQPIGFTIPIME